MWFRSKIRPRNGIFGFGCTFFKHHFRFFARSLTIVPRSLLGNRTETLATQATAAQKLNRSKRTSKETTMWEGRGKMIERITPAFFLLTPPPPPPPPPPSFSRYRSFDLLLYETQTKVIPKKSPATNDMVVRQRSC